MSDKLSYEDLVEHNPKIADILDPKTYEFVQNSNDRTAKSLGKTWLQQSSKNARVLLRKHGLLVDNCGGFGTNKAVIMIGAGPSLKKNEDFLLELCRYNARFKFNEQPFLFMVSNHQLKPCLEKGIIPHFVVLADASADLYSQFDKISHRGQNTILLCSLHCHPKITMEWSAKGRPIQFYAPSGKEYVDAVKKEADIDISGKQMLQGGNVSNVAWMASLAALGSRIFICVGNDLSYELEDDVGKQRDNYYADGNYSSNLASQRDEAKGTKKWMGFSMRKSPFTDEAILDFKPMGTVGTLYNYKTWAETMVAMQDMSKKAFHYYNCTEGGILGVVAKSYLKEDLDTSDNWTIMDTILPRRWKTRLLQDAAVEVLTAREQCRIQRETSEDVGNVIVGPHQMVGASDVGQNRIII